MFGTNKSDVSPVYNGCFSFKGPGFHKTKNTILFRKETTDNGGLLSFTISRTAVEGIFVIKCSHCYL